MYEALRLSTLREGESAYVTEVSAGPAMDRRLTDLGLVRGTRVTCVLRSPAGDPCAYLLGQSVEQGGLPHIGVARQRHPLHVATAPAATS